MWALITLFVLSFPFPLLYNISWIALLVFLIFLVADFFLLKQLARKINITRTLDEKYALGDFQMVMYKISNNNKQSVSLTIYDEFPYQLQIRNAMFEESLDANEVIDFDYSFIPKTRGEYVFGNIQIFIISVLKLIEWRKTVPAQNSVKVFPSFIQMKKYELQLFSKTATLTGIKRIRERGENEEFEHIKNYVSGDNIRAINWKATSKMNKLMVNQFENTKSQMVYCIVDKGRVMEMPFEGLSLLDYAINSSLVIANIILRKYDKIGLITFGKKIDSFIKSEDKKHQLQRIAHILYDQKTDFKESNYELLFKSIRSKIKRRSVLFLFTNFESLNDLNNSLKYLIGINKLHLLVVISFKNTEVIKEIDEKPRNISGTYYRTFALNHIIEKEKIMLKLQSAGIQTILTTPDKLSIDTINKYLEIKAKRMK